jgi:tRNA (Thr-GGU) A37 N-methylase
LKFLGICEIFYFHKFKDFSLFATPPHNNPNKIRYGVFATHSPKRPNHIGVSNVSLMEAGENFIRINGCDMVSGTPVLDIKAQRTNPD